MDPRIILKNMKNLRMLRNNIKEKQLQIMEMNR